MCVYACTWVPGRVDVCMRISACSLANPACHAYAPYRDVICGIYHVFRNYLVNGAIFGKKFIENKMCVLFSLQILSKTFLIL